LVAAVQVRMVAAARVHIEQTQHLLLDQQPLQLRLEQVGQDSLAMLHKEIQDHPLLLEHQLLHLEVAVAVRLLLIQLEALAGPEVEVALSPAQVQVDLQQVRHSQEQLE
jgi:hypothetical protein